MKWNQIIVNLDVLREYVAKPKIIVDVGAYIGYTARAFRDAFPEAKIIAIEPIEESFEELERACSRLDNIELHCVAAGKEKGRLTLSSPFAEHPAFPFSGMSAVSGKGYMSRVVDMLPLTDIVESADIIKIHTQYYVKEVLEGAMPIIKEHHPLLVIERHTPTEEVLAVIPEYKYVMDIGYGLMLYHEDIVPTKTTGWLRLYT